MDSIGNKPTAVVQVAFIKGLMKLDGFGILLYSATVSFMVLTVTVVRESALLAMAITL